MATFHGYILLEISAAVADALTANQRNSIKGAVSDLITIIKKNGDAGLWPPYSAQVRFSNDKRAIIVEGNFDGITKAGFVQKLATRLGVVQATVNTALTITVFGGGSANWETSRQACLAYLAANRPWESAS